ncbi:2-hydroxyacid dehydrogenase [Glutamicibacter nicotianae]|uniref:2-hydroxyacid dehydrogenase n=1 Tax=Glutamicibacter nicotianae TaxID=37929 RepID=UPI00195C5441|nr:2-hydroxyacid dehydrogenase [Glutamicibacter nicotianae]MBM7768214.1 phosphoglycerate dehydrogenase-like enzyme [Glutamicibacter nicotianae]
MSTQRTISFPTQELLDAVGPIPENLKAVLWDLENDPETPLEDIDIAVLPYMANPQTLKNVRKAPNVKVVQTQTTGFDGMIDLIGDRADINTAAGVHAAATAEMALGLAIASLRGFPQSVRDQQQGRWNPQQWPGLADRTVGLVGVGGIGEEIRKRLEPFEINLLRFGSTARTDEHGEVFATSELAALAPEIEVLILIVPLNDSTRHLVDAKLLAKLPDGATVINVARGPVVDTDAIVAEVASGRLNMASDVFDPEPLPAGHPLWQHPNALVIPHNGGNTKAFFPRMVKLLMKQVQAWAAGNDGENLVHRS